MLQCWGSGGWLQEGRLVDVKDLAVWAHRVRVGCAWGARGMCMAYTRRSTSPSLRNRSTAELHDAPPKLGAPPPPTKPASNPLTAEGGCSSSPVGAPPGQLSSRRGEAPRGRLSEWLAGPARGSRRE